MVALTIGADISSRGAEVPSAVGSTARSRDASGRDDDSKGGAAVAPEKSNG